jgi:integrase/recombinase XerC
MLLNQAIDEFLEARGADGIKTITIDWYRKYLNRFCDAFNGYKLDEITIIHLRGFIDSLYGRNTRYKDASQRTEIAGGLSNATIDNYHRAIKAFFNWCIEEYGVPEKNLMKRIKRPRRKPPSEGIDSKAANYEDIAKLIDTCDESPAGVRDKAILALMADTGCRVGAVVTLCLKDVYVDQARLVVTTKFDERHEHYLSPETLQVLKRWLATRPTWLPHGYVFCAISDKSHGAALLPSAINQMIDRRKEHAIGIAGPVNPHSFRHALGTRIYEETGDPLTVQALLHHKELSTSQIYIHAKRGHWQKQHEKISPAKEVLRKK